MNISLQNELNLAPGGATAARRSPDRSLPRAGAFTLIELLVVIVIIGILAAVGLPAIRGMNKSNATISANRQFLDDLAYARQRAIVDHTTVYVLFDPPWITNVSPFPFPTADAIALKQYTNLFAGQYTMYALLSLRSSGEQPGRATPRYLTAWRSMPNGVFIAQSKFALAPLAPPNAVPFATNSIFPFPYISSTFTNPLPPMNLPYIGFDYLGRLVSGRDEYIPLARGSIFYAHDAVTGGFSKGPADVQEIPPGNSINNSNVIHIDWLTGRARLERQEIQ